MIPFRMQRDNHNDQDENEGVEIIDLRDCDMKSREKMLPLATSYYSLSKLYLNKNKEILTPQNCKNPWS